MTEFYSEAATGNSSPLAPWKKSRPRRGGPLSSWEGEAFALELEVHAASDIAEIETIELQRHVILVHIDQAERGVVEVLVHSV